MSLNEGRAERLTGVLPVIAAVLIVFAGLVVTGALAGVYALAGFAIVAVAAFFAMRAGNEHKRLAAPLTVSEGTNDPLRTILGGLPDPVIALDREERVLALNEPARALAPALRQGEPISLTLRMPELRDAVRRAFARDEEQRIEYSERVPTDRWFQAVAMPVRRALDAARPDLVLLTFRDLTTSRRVDEMRADFVANASHELRTPLSALSGFIDTLQGSARDDPKARERFLAIMQQQAGRMARLIEDLLSLSRVELNVHRRPEKPVDLVPIVRQVTDGLQTLAHDRGVAINVEAANAATVLGDHDELVSLFENLVENAIKYGATGKRVDVKLAPVKGEEGEPEVQISVRDYGPGIAPEHFPRLTERFYRVDIRESHDQGGTGLGLALVKHILNRHRGRLSIESAPGAGATFTVNLPTAESAASE
jgi:two-component system, OmpR family, phosphate regulon sensor histidine kinase PhoR